MGAGTSVISTHGLTTLRDSVKLSQLKLVSYQYDPDAKSLSTSYYKLEQDISKTLKDISGASSNAIAADQSGYTAEMVVLDDERDRILTRIRGYTTYDIIRQISYGVGILFGVIIITNIMISETWYYKLFFYTPWAAIFYPFALLYCLVDPPAWRGIFPLVEISTNNSWWLRYLPFILYNPLGKLQEGYDGKTALRAFSLVVIIFIVGMQFLI